MEEEYRLIVKIINGNDHIMNDSSRLTYTTNWEKNQHIAKNDVIDNCINNNYAFYAVSEGIQENTNVYKSLDSEKNRVINELLSKYLNNYPYISTSFYIVFQFNLEVRTTDKKIKQGKSKEYKENSAQTKFRSLKRRTSSQ